MNKNIVIIGAGASGMAAATKLVLCGFENVTILEAENRFGGRINTIPFGENVVDMGAQWCHGKINNVVYEMAKDKNLLELSNRRYEKYRFIRSNGEEIPHEQAAKLWNLAFELYDGHKYIEEKKLYRGSFGNFFAEKYNEGLKTNEYRDISAELARECYDMFQKSFNAIDGANSWYETSSNGHEYEKCEGEQNLGWKDKGYVTLFGLLQNKIPGGKENQRVIDVIPLIQFNKTVSKITYNLPDGTIKVECEDKSSYSADHLICTVSLGVLKERHWSLFDPILTQKKINTIDGLMIGTVDKIFLEFDNPFWDGNWIGFFCLWRLEELKVAHVDPVNGDWLHGIKGFFPVSRFQPNLLCSWIVGDVARKMEQKSYVDVKAGVEKILRMFLKNWNIPNTKAMVRSTWYSNPHFRGSYSNFTLKAEALQASPCKLAEPIKDPNGTPVIQFAGEATSSTHYGCVHGAVETGWREADRLIELYK